MSLLIGVLLVACGDEPDQPPLPSSSHTFVLDLAGGCEGLTYRCIKRNDGDAWICPAGAPSWTLTSSTSDLATDTCAVRPCTLDIQSYPPNIVNVTCPWAR